jgi:hypothetical protein
MEPRINYFENAVTAKAVKHLSALGAALAQSSVRRASRLAYPRG